MEMIRIIEETDTYRFCVCRHNTGEIINVRFYYGEDDFVDIEFTQAAARALGFTNKKLMLQKFLSAHHLDGMARNFARAKWVRLFSNGSFFLLNKRSLLIKEQEDEEF